MKVGRFGLGFKSVLHMTGEKYINCAFVLKRGGFIYMSKLIVLTRFVGDKSLAKDSQQTQFQYQNYLTCYLSIQIFPACSVERD